MGFYKYKDSDQKLFANNRPSHLTKFFVIKLINAHRELLLPGKAIKKTPRNT